MTNINRDSLALQAMRNLMAKGFTDQTMIISAGSDVIGGDDAAMKAARRVYDKHFKIFTAN